MKRSVYHRIEISVVCSITSETRVWLDESGVHLWHLNSNEVEADCGQHIKLIKVYQ